MATNYSEVNASDQPESTKERDIPFFNRTSSQHHLQQQQQQQQPTTTNNNQSTSLTLSTSFQELQTSNRKHAIPIHRHLPHCSLQRHVCISLTLLLST